MSFKGFHRRVRTGVVGEGSGPAAYVLLSGSPELLMHAYPRIQEGLDATEALRRRCIGENQVCSRTSYPLHSHRLSPVPRVVTRHAE